MPDGFSSLLVRMHQSIVLMKFFQPFKNASVLVWRLLQVPGVEGVSCLLWKGA